MLGILVRFHHAQELPTGAAIIRTINLDTKPLGRAAVMSATPKEDPAIIQNKGERIRQIHGIGIFSHNSGIDPAATFVQTFGRSNDFCIARCGIIPCGKQASIGKLRNPRITAGGREGENLRRHSDLTDAGVSSLIRRSMQSPGYNNNHQADNRR